MKTNRALFMGLVALVYGLMSLILLATGYSLNDCVEVMGTIMGVYLGVALILMFARMILVVAASDPEEKVSDFYPRRKVLGISIPEWVGDWMHRFGSAGMVILDLLPVFRNTIILVTLCLGMLAGVNFVYSLDGVNLVPDLFRLAGTLGGLYAFHAVALSAISWIERSDMFGSDVEWESRPLGSL